MKPDRERLDMVSRTELGSLLRLKWQGNRYLDRSTTGARQARTLNRSDLKAWSVSRLKRRRAQPFFFFPVVDCWLSQSI